MLVTMLLAGSARAAPSSSGNPKLDEARRLFDDLELEKAARALAAAIDGTRGVEHSFNTPNALMTGLGLRFTPTP